MDPKKKAQIKRLQDNLLAIRKFAGWTTQELGDEIGVTKQTISNLERKTTEMTLTQYLAIRTILDDEIERQPENETLRTAVAVLLDADELSEEKQVELNEQMNMYASAMAGGAKREAMMRKALEALSPIAGIAGGIAAGVATKSPIVATTMWLSIMRSLNREEKK